MEEEIQQRIAGNEAVFRQVNEALRDGKWPGEEDTPIAFRCECGRLGCSQLIELNIGAYERVRAHGRRFLVAPDHDIQAAETVIETHPRYVVVEKTGRAGRAADATDPRS